MTFRILSVLWLVLLSAPALGQDLPADDGKADRLLPTEPLEAPAAPDQPAPPEAAAGQPEPAPDQETDEPEPPEEPEEETEPGQEVLEDGQVLPTEDTPSLIDRCRAKAREARLYAGCPPQGKYPYLEWHGYFRFRSDLYTDVSLGTYASNGTEFTATSLFLPPLIDNYANTTASPNDKLSSESEKTTGTANMRFRLSPIIRVSDTIDVRTTVDVLDNLVLGSTPDYLGFTPSPLVPLDTLTLSQVPPVAGVNAWNDSIVVKQAYARIVLGESEDLSPRSFNLGVLTVGRYAFDWGLGILTSSGDYERWDTSLSAIDRFHDLDADFGNYLDRITWSRNFGPFRFLIGYGWLSTGPTSRMFESSVGQEYDLEDQDDVWQVEAALYSRAETRAEFDRRRKAFYTGAPMLDWGLYAAFRSQSKVAEVPASGDLDPQAQFNQTTLYDRSAWILTPDLWLRFDWRPDLPTRYYAALEAAAVIGRADTPAATGVTGTPADLPDIDIFQLGLAFESNVTMGVVSFGLDSGYASGDSGEIFGAWAGKNTAWGDDHAFDVFSFNKNYIVDMLLYREVLGTISNTIYVKPHFDFDLLQGPQSAFGGMVNALYAMTATPEAYPGNSRNLGFEMEAALFYEELNSVFATVGVGILVPLAALDRPEDYLIDGVDARTSVWAWTMQGNLFLVF